MKIKTFLFGFLSVLTFWIIVPLFLILINSYFNLPVFKNPACKTIGILLFVVGILVIVYCAGLFKKIGKGTPVSAESPRHIVSRGFYKYTRNPMYLANMLMFLGEFFVFGHILLFFYFLISILALHLYVVCVEEPELKKRFGKKYVEYTKGTPRWLLKQKR